MFGLRRKQKRLPPFHPDTPLFRVSDADVVTLGQGFEGFLCMAATGGGKSSGPVDLIVRSLLGAGVGVLALLAKADFGYWQRVCRETGRERDLIRIAPDGHKIDVLQAALDMPGTSDEASAVVLDTLADVGSRTSHSGTGESFWVQGNQKNFRRCLAIARLGLGRPTLRDLARVFTTLPGTQEEAASAEWALNSFAGRCLSAAADRQRAGELSPADARKLDLCGEFVEEWGALNEKTRSIFSNIATNVLDKFVFGTAGEVIAAGHSTFSLDRILTGGVGVFDYPSLVFGDPARFAQIAVKTLVQQAVLKRSVGPGTVPVAIIADEFQQFVTPSLDCAFQAVARSARGITVYATQSIPLLVSELGGGPKAEREVEALISNLQTRFIGQSTCTFTNDFFSRTCGEHREILFSGSSPLEPWDPIGDVFGGESKATCSYAEQYRPQFPSWQFGALKKGGPANGFVVEAVVMQGGRVWKSTGKTWMVSRFRQRV